MPDANQPQKQAWKEKIRRQLATTLGRAWTAEESPASASDSSSISNDNIRNQIMTGKRTRRQAHLGVPSLSSTTSTSTSTTMTRPRRKASTIISSSASSSLASFSTATTPSKRALPRTTSTKAATTIKRATAVNSTRTITTTTTSTTKSTQSHTKARKHRLVSALDKKLNDAAHASRLHAHGLCVEEFVLFQYHLGKSNLDHYLQVRNTMLYLWRESPKEPLTLQRAFTATKDLGLHQALIPHIYEFLLRSGYINFGMCPYQDQAKHHNISNGTNGHSTASATTSEKAHEDSRAASVNISSPAQKTIVVIGSGIAGVAAARQLENLLRYYAPRFAPGLPPKVVVLEARNRIGGRMHSLELKFRSPSSKTSPPAAVLSKNSSGTTHEKTIEQGHQQTQTGQKMKHAVDLGAQIITGFDNGNPMEIIVRRQLSDMSLHYLVNETCDLFEHDGRLVPKDKDVHCETVFNRILDQACKLRDSPKILEPLTHYLQNRTKQDSQSPGRVQSTTTPTLGHSMDYFLESHPEFKTWTAQELSLIHWHYANLEFANATPLDQLSLRHWDQDDDYEFSGNHCMVVQGYGQVPIALSKGLDVRLNMPVASIKRAHTKGKASSNGREQPQQQGSITIQCRNGTTIACDKTVVTVPLGVLKSRQINFQPPLPEWKENAIRRMGFGLLNKLVLVFDKPFWDSSVELFGYVGGGKDGSSGKGYDLKAYRSSRGKFYMFWNCIVVSGLPVLVTLMAGQSAYDSEKMTREELVKEAVETLALIYPQIKRIPKPVETVVTRWSRDEFAQGSYSFVGRDGTGEDYDLLAKSVEDQLYFAGEATSRHYPATAHGAYLSGIKVAKEVLDSLIGPQTLDTPYNVAGINKTKSDRTPTTAAAHRRRDYRESSNESNDSHLLSLEEAHTSDSSPPPEKTETTLIGHGFALPRRRGRAARSMIARFVADPSDAEDDNDEDEDEDEYEGNDEASDFPEEEEEEEVRYKKTKTGNGPLSKVKRDLSEPSRRRGRPVYAKSKNESSPLRNPQGDDKIGTGARGTDAENNSELDHISESYTAMTSTQLQRLIQGTILVTAEDLSDLTRPIRLQSPYPPSTLTQQEQPQDQEEKTEVVIHESHHQGQEEEAEEEREKSTTDEYEAGEEIQEVIEETANNESDQELDSASNDEDLDLTLSPSSEKTEGELDLENNTSDSIEETLLPDDKDKINDAASFDTAKTLSPLDTNYLIFVPSGKTIEAQYFSLLTAFWIAKHSNRTLIYAPPMLSPPSLASMYPVFAGRQGKRLQRWTNLYDFKQVVANQPVVAIDTTRPFLRTPFTTEMALEEENPTTTYQPNLSAVTTNPAPASIRCQGPSIGGSSWKSLDFAGRHFLNSYNLQTEFDTLDDRFWNLDPEAIQRNWAAGTPATKDNFRQKSFVCISGTEFIGSMDPIWEEKIWQEYGPKMAFSRGIRLQGRQSVLEVMRALEREDRKDGYIGVHIDKLPPPELCAKKGPESHACEWTVDLISKRIALLQQTEGVQRPVVVTTTETDLAILSTMDRQPGWLRIGADDDANGLFGGLLYEDLGGYGEAATRLFIMAHAAIFVGSRDSALAMQAAFRIKSVNSIRELPMRWELY
ncbi:hypothetical protein BGZ83_011367 [Gryganskiella cystojenkinii]|nr:hypothetical protein BGZ83_011367 [Gryganskiella cystojenkinii]